MLARWQAQIAEARQTSPEDAAAAWYRRALAEARTDSERALIREEIERQADDRAYAAMDWHRHEWPSQVPEAQSFYRQATGTAPAKLSEHIKGWRAQYEAKPKTKDMFETAIRRFVAKHATVEDVTTAKVQAYVSGMQSAPSTVRKDLTAIRSFWKYLQRPDVAAAPHDVDPFAKLILPKKQKLYETTYRPFPADAIAKLYWAADADETLQHLIKLAAFTGARIEELAALRLEQVRKDHFEIVDAKTEAGHRLVPIDKRLSKLVAKPRKASGDGYLLKLTENKYGDRSNAIGKRFGRLKAKIGYDKRYVFHSIRKTFITALEHAGVLESTVQDIVGHERDTLTGSVYSGKSTMAMRRTAIAKARYPGLT